MNSTCLLPDEYSEWPTIRLTGQRAHALQRASRAKPGDALHFIIPDSKRIVARVQSASKLEMVCAAEVELPMLARTPIVTIVAAARPPTMKRVIQFVTQSGIAELHIVAAEQSEPSYLDSHLLQPLGIRNEVLAGLEQAFDATPPIVAVHSSLTTAPVPREGVRLFGGLQGQDASNLHFSMQHSPITVAVGPESGWSTSEAAYLLDQGFHEVSLGPRVMRVDVALSVLCGAALGVFGTNRTANGRSSEPKE